MLDVMPNGEECDVASANEREGGTIDRGPLSESVASLAGMTPWDLTTPGETVRIHEDNRKEAPNVSGR